MQLTPDQLWNECRAYFEAVNELNDEANFKPYTETGLAAYLGVPYHEWVAFKDENPYLEESASNYDFGFFIRGIVRSIAASQELGKTEGFIKPGQLEEFYKRKGI